jgi:hypothetical protein
MDSALNYRQDRSARHHGFMKSEECDRLADRAIDDLEDLRLDADRALASPEEIADGLCTVSSSPKYRLVIGFGRWMIISHYNAE